VVELAPSVLELVRLYGPLALCLFTFLEASMLFPFLPSEVVIPAAAALLVTDPASLLVFVLAASVGGTLGAFVPFWVFYRTRFGETGWLGDHLRVSDERIDRAQTWFRRWGQSSVCWGRFLPFVRSVISVPAGVARMAPTRFGAYTIAGSTGFYAATGWLVYYGRQRSLFSAAVDAAVANPALAALATLAVVAVALLVGERIRR